MRNELLHGEKTPVQVEDIRTLEHIAARYVRLALFKEVNQSPEAPLTGGLASP